MCSENRYANFIAPWKKKKKINPIIKRGCIGTYTSKFIYDFASHHPRRTNFCSVSCNFLLINLENFQGPRQLKSKNLIMIFLSHKFTGQAQCSVKWVINEVGSYEMFEALGH